VGMREFDVGHRVITKQEQRIYPQLTGYWGHVVAVAALRDDHPERGPLLLIDFEGRSGGDVNRVYMSQSWPCWADEVEHAD
jgi:hypothetical protein